MAVRHHTLDIYGAELYLATTRKQWKALRRRLDFKAPEAVGIAQFATFHPKGGGITVPHLVARTRCPAAWLASWAAVSIRSSVVLCAFTSSHSTPWGFVADRIVRFA
ncbi:MAG TPA: hypothetical protein VFJ19_10035 [Nocardioidaceae bacterium]|nr:hypothetical protein [Nocardioidaceae bacterium]